MRTIWWLTWRELISRKGVFLAGLGMVSAAVGLCATTELVLRARESAVAVTIDQAGPAAHVVPSGMHAGDLARFELGAKVWDRKEAAALKRIILPHMRCIEQRLVSTLQADDVTIPVVGIEPNETLSPFAALRQLSAQQVVLGGELAKRLGLQMGGTVSLWGRKLQVVSVLPVTAGVDDLALFMPMEELQELLGRPGAINELRLFPAAGRLSQALVSKLESGTPAVSVIQVDRGDVAESGMNRSLTRHRHVLYAVVAMVIALCMAMWSYLNSAERRLELATVTALGGTTMTVLWILVARAATVGLLGAALGYGIGVVTAVAQDFEAAITVIGSWSLPLIMLSGATVLSIVGALPVAIMTAAADHVALLQE